MHTVNMRETGNASAAEYGTAETGELIPLFTRDVAKDNHLDCFVCRQPTDRQRLSKYIDTLVIITESHRDAATIASWLDNYVQLSSDIGRPSWYRLKIAACDKHREHLALLSKAVSVGVMCVSDVQRAVNLNNSDHDPNMVIPSRDVIAKQITPDYQDDSMT